MNPGIIAFIVVYCVLLICYFFTETSGNLKLRAPNKIALALMFVTVGCVFAFNKFDRSVQYLYLLALILAAIGDIVLLFDFFRGGVFFLAGNIAFVIYQIALIRLHKVPFTSYWWVLIIIAILWSIYPILFEITPDSFQMLDKYKYPLYFYLASIVPSGSFGIVVMIILPHNFFFLGLGLLLFMISDFFIVLHKFVFIKSKLVHRLNSAFYFVGMLLVVLNFALL